MNLDSAEVRLETNSDDNDEVVRIYLDLCAEARRISKLKSRALTLVGENLDAAGTSWDENEFATYGFTQPRPRSKVSEKMWREALEENESLAQLQEEYDKARAPFLVDATQTPRPYVKEKKGSTK